MPAGHCPFSFGPETARIRHVRVLAALVFVLSCPVLALGQAPAVQARYLIVPGQGIGPVRLGMTIAQVRAVMGHEVQTTTDPMAGATVVAWKTQGNGRFGVWFGNDGKAINVAINLDARYATAQGIRAGDPVDKVRVAMGAPLDESSMPTVSLGRLQVLRYSGLLFYIPESALDAKLNGKVYSIIVAAASVEAAPATPSAPPQPGPSVPTPPPAQSRPAPPAQPAAPATATVVFSAAPAPGGPAVIVPGQSIGALRLGMKLADVTGLFGAATQTARSRDGSVTHWWLDASKRQGFGVEVVRGQVDRLYIINDARYVTAAGLHVGSTEVEIRTALGPPAAVKIDSKAQKETLRYDDLGVWFEIQLDSQSPAYATVTAIAVMAAGGPSPRPAGPGP